MSRIRAAAAAAVLAATLAVAPAAAAVPTETPAAVPAVTTTVRADDSWIVKAGVRAAWNEQSYSDQRTLCAYFLIRPRSFLNRMMRVALDDTYIANPAALRSWMARFFARQCARI